MGEAIQEVSGVCALHGSTDEHLIRWTGFPGDRSGRTLVFDVCMEFVRCSSFYAGVRHRPGSVKGQARDVWAEWEGGRSSGSLQ